ncbi:unnamed protein product [Lymnaea stagnalis]|uniref:Uncharacterized protein n=1 Tax=Lymnaea stagnalis TaxID=6523 RepID=A0AAV2H469_LYMST
MICEETFFTKLGEIPVLNDGWTTAWSYYSKVKDYNGLTKFTLDVAESGVKKAAEITTPVVQRYQSQIDTVNTYACNKLDDIENKYPVIKQPTGELKNACMEYVQPVVGKVKPVVTYAQDVVNNSKRRVNSIKQCGSNLVNGARDLGVDTMNKAVTVTMETPPGRFVTKTVDCALTCADNLMDKFIPEEQQDHDKSGVDAPEELNKPEEMALMEPSTERVVVHFKSVSNKLRRRMFQKAMKDFQGAKLRTVEAIGKLHNTVDLIYYAKKNIGTARDKVEDMWSRIIDTEEKSEENSDPNLHSGLLEERIVTLGRVLVARVKSGVSALEKASNEAGQFVRHPISKSKEYKDFIYHFSSDISTVSVQKARESLDYFQRMLFRLIDNVESPNWLSVDIEMDNIDLEEEDVIAAEGSERQKPEESKEKSECGKESTTELPEETDSVTEEMNDDNDTSMTDNS